MNSPATTAQLYGWRRAHLVARIEDGQIADVAFQSLNQPNLFRVVAEAHCRYHPHRPPADGCTCGFYALSDRDRIVRGDYRGHKWVLNSVILQVRMTGDVIEGEAGYRAERQTVVCVELPEKCRYPECDRHAGVMRAETVAHAITPEGKWVPLLAVCRAHVADHLAFHPSALESVSGARFAWRAAA